MNTLHKIELWGNLHHPLWADFLRIPFGAILCFKGIFFISNSTFLLETMRVHHLGDDLWLAFLIGWVHISGGLFLAVGMLTRLAALVQLPFVAGSIVFVNARWYPGGGGSELVLAVVCLFLLLFYLVEGPGEFSLDALVWKKGNK